MDELQKWWPFGAFLLSSLGGFWLGQKRSQWKIDDLGAWMQRLERRVETLETQGRTEGQTLASINATLVAMQRALDGIQISLKDKVDKA